MLETYEMACSIRKNLARICNSGGNDHGRKE
jgi:hypothetical protein